MSRVLLKKFNHKFIIEFKIVAFCFKHRFLICLEKKNKIIFEKTKDFFLFYLLSRMRFLFNVILITSCWYKIFSLNSLKGEFSQSFHLTASLENDILLKIKLLNWSREASKVVNMNIKSFWIKREYSIFFALAVSGRCFFLKILRKSEIPGRERYKVYLTAALEF